MVGEEKEDFLGESNESTEGDLLSWELQLGVVLTADTIGLGLPTSYILSITI